jgi:PqqD family protein of HPr-rel-A system
MAFSAASGQRCWVSVEFHALLWETWEHEHFVFNPRSGETHVLNDLAGEMLRALAEKPHTAAELALRFRDRLAGGGPDDVQPAVDALLRQLDQLGLVDADST